MNKALIFTLLCVISFVNIYLIYKKVGKLKTPPAPPALTIRANPLPSPKSDPAPEPPAPKAVEPQFISVPKVRDGENSVLGDILSHSRGAPFGDGSGRSTNGHETTHGINSEIRNSHNSQGKVNGFYVLEGRGVVIEEPNMRKSRVAEFVPQSLRSYRYGTYITGQSAWDDTPLYIFDEWVAYVNGGAVCIDDVQKGRHRESWTDGVSGCLDFSIYSIALAMAVQKYDPQYFQNNEQFRNFLIWNLKRAQAVYEVGSKMREFAWEKQDRLLADLLSNPDAAEMRAFIKEHLEGVWLDSKVQTPNFERQNGETIRLEPMCSCKNH